MADGWSHKFSEPIELPDGKKLITLQDVITWLAKSVPASEHNDHEVQVAGCDLPSCGLSMAPAKIILLRRAGFAGQMGQRGRSLAFEPAGCLS